MANKPKYIPKRNVSGIEIIQVLKDSQIIETDTDIEARELFKSPSVDEDFIDIDMAEGDTKEECYINLTSSPFSFYDWRNYGGDKESDVEIYFKNIINSSEDYLSGFTGNTIPFIQLLGNPYDVLSVMQSVSPGSVFNNIGEHINKLLNVKVGCDYNTMPTSNAQFDIEVYPFHGFDYSQELTLYYNGENKIDSAATLISSVPGGWYTLAGAAVIGGGLTVLIKVGVFRAFNQALLSMLGGPYNPLTLTLQKITAPIESAIAGLGDAATAFLSTTGGMLLADACIAFAFFVGCLAVTEALLRVFSPDTFINNTINDGYKFHSISTGGLYNNFDIIRSAVTIALGKVTDITTRAVSGTAEEGRIISANH
ncbi:MAG: hypothetical protein WC346_03830, partial [Methanogenium sp.]